MTIKEAEKQLEDVKKYFPNVEITLLNHKKGLGEQVEYRLPHGKYFKEFLSRHSTLLEACIYAYGNYRFQEGKDFGFEAGRTSMSQEFTSLLDLSSLGERLDNLENRLDRI